MSARVLAFLQGTGRYLVLLATRRPELVHLHTASYGSFFRKAVLLWIARVAGVKTVLHVHGAEFHLFHDRAPRLLRLVIRRTLEETAAVVALGDRWAERLRRISPGARVVVIPNAVRPVEDGDTREASERVQVVFLGEIGDRKGAFALLDAWAAATTGDSPARLTLAGDGEVERARRRVTELGLVDSVALRRWLTPRQVDEVLAGADLLVLPSRNEGQPMAVLEAMARGVCVVASDVGGLPDMIEDGVSGVLVRPDAPSELAAVLGRLLDDADERRRLGEGARKRFLAEFDLSVVWPRIDRLYREVIAI
ncbi:glycosyltransferase family 4 protein [Pseudonocardia halophobica]|uniref:glycosyltransferase family 4 protein n=1 Tax=Pseudonocardia halophobica TaxID=29401 RepID=UPI003D8BE553